MRKRWNDMKYNEDLDCWIVFWGDNTGYKVRCGDWLDLHLGDGRKLSCRMELGKQWFIVVGRNDTRLYLKPNETYQVDI
ncbi:DUF5348 domain-containing protein [Schinkia azotoformans]|uniref:DUF5348 domain-containing protein n=1 Tax=Schinkia azotoformans TaxID=1454 RepID=UPI002DBBEF09|nr:DUF5348 domain-containing protein [Schinkia azotoformans]MEC1748253.1 DUF5348 domain-containing protein [Schinkia azotoformans]MEC1789831.1 DUF5348 domain-containing protein [Schinkia azotoformans]MED4378176.1 DUF5348 domain-containing protein [Schinkia azotoformans]